MNENLKHLIDDILCNDQSTHDEKEYQNYRKYIEMSAYENELIDKKVKYIAGIDEAGRGPLAGPVVAACVILPEGFYLPGLNDSKKLSKKKREAFYAEITQHAVSYGVGIATVDEIDRYNIYNCAKLAMTRAVNNLTVKPDHLLIDAMNLDLDIPQTNIIKGDAKSVTIAAASVIAKVTRDHYMKQLDEKYPMYNFKSNSGYGTKEHISAINEHGIISAHRKTFEPVKSKLLTKTTLFNF